MYVINKYKNTFNVIIYTKKKMNSGYDLLQTSILVNESIIYV